MPYIGKQPANVPVTADDIPANSIDASKIIDGAITIADIADDAVTADKLANSINTAIAANTAKTGITSSQASAITANTAKTGITSSQATAITAALPKAGGTMTGDLILGDNVKLEVGSAAGGDLQIYHDGSNSYIKDDGTGSLYIKADNDIFLARNANSEVYLKCRIDGAVTLYHNDNEKIATTATGINVTGASYSSSNIGLNADNYLGFSDDSFARFVVNDTEVFRATASGNVGIGTSSPAVQNNGAGLVLDIANTGSASTTADNAELVVRSSSRYSALSFITPTDKAATINFGDTADANIGIIQYNHANDAMSFTTNTTTRMTIDSTGAVTMPAQPAFNVGKNLAQDNLSLGGFSVIAFSTEIFDQNSDFASNVFTAPVTGKYQFSSNIRLENIDSAAAFYILRINTSNRTYSTIFDMDFGQDNNYWSLQISTLADMDANDTAFLEIYQEGGTAQTDINANHNYTNFSGYLAC